MINRTALSAALTGIVVLCSLPETGRASLTIRIIDRDGNPVPEVAVFARDLQQGTEPAAATAARPSVTIDQHDLTFDPYISVVETGTEIRFSNDDVVRHHVYSFSAARRFDLTIDSGSIHSEPLAFDTSGLVTLGCNIHDDMQAYVLVIDTRHFALTGPDGRAALTLEAGRYEVGVWTPRLPPRANPQPRIIEYAPEDDITLSVELGDKLYPPHKNSKTSLLWDSY